MKLRYIYVPFTLLIITLLGLTAFTNKAVPTSTNNKDRIKFSHKVHSTLVDCESCHIGITEASSLRQRVVPTHESCQSCHDVEEPESCNLCHYDENYEALVQVDNPNLIFNHALHMQIENTTCESCHKGLSEVDYSFESTSAKPPMSSCYTCHNDVNVAANTCESCHYSTVNLKPADHKQSDFMRAHKFAAQKIDANCAMCHDNQSCESCHAGTSKLSDNNSTPKMYAPYSPSNFVDGTKQQQVTRVHTLNYRFTHGIDAKSKITDCQSCHEVESFCVQCHSSTEGDFALGGFTPSSHARPDFIRLARGSGGGWHATLARRDLESCIACHDVSGQDPTCMTCHADNR